MEHFLINGNRIKIEKGDYILSYGENYTFHTFDNRSLSLFGTFKIKKIELSKSIVSNIQFKDIKSEKKSNSVIKWIF